MSSTANAGLRRGLLRGFLEGLVGQTAELQVSPPCVGPPLLTTVTSARDLRTTPSAGRDGWRIRCSGCWESSARVYGVWASNTGRKTTASRAFPGIPRWPASWSIGFGERRPGWAARGRRRQNCHKHLRSSVTPLCYEKNCLRTNQRLPLKKKRKRKRKKTEEHSGTLV